jgi:hypothetical protein
LRHSRHYYYLSGRGLGTQNGALHGLQGGKRPDVASPAFQSAEVVRLTDEIIRLAQRTAWSGVNETYMKLESKGDEAFNLIPKELTSAANIHKLGADASRALGNTQNWRKRLWLAKTSLDTSVGAIDHSMLRPITEDLDYIDKNFGSVTIAPRAKSTSKRQREQVKLIAVVLSSDPDQRSPDQLRSIEFAEQEIKKSGSFTGLLPAGYYKLADESFTVENGPTEYTGKRPTNVHWGK